MPSRARAKKLTIKRFAHEYFQRVNYIDIYGRKVGFDYEFILAEIKQHFPSAKTSKTWLRRMAYEIKADVRMPVRRHSRRALAEGYAMSLLVKPSRHSIDGIRVDVKFKFPDQTITLARLRSLELWLVNNGFTVPPRP